MGGVGAALFAVLFADWYERKLPGGGTESLSAWEAFTVPDVLLALLALAAVATLLLVSGSRTAAPGVAYETLVLLAGIICVIVCVVRLIDLPAGGLSLQPGAWAGLALALALCASCVVAMRDERRSTPDKLTDSTGVPVDTAPEPERLPAPPA